MRIPDREAAQLYVSVHDGVPGDVSYYRRHCEGLRVLELGSGTGRVAIELGQVAREVVGLELEAGMVEEARGRLAAAPADVRERVRFAQGDMSDFDLGARFDRVVIPFSGLYCVLDPEALERCMACIHRHLEPDGRLLFDAYAADRFHAEASPDDHAEDDLDHVADIEHEGEELTVLEQSSWEPEAQRLDAIYVYERDDGSVRRRIVVGHRYLLSDQIEPLLERAGLRLERLEGGFDGEALDGEGSLVVEASVRPA